MELQLDSVQTEMLNIGSLTVCIMMHTAEVCRTISDLDSREKIFQFVPPVVPIPPRNRTQVQLVNDDNTQCLIS